MEDEKNERRDCTIEKDDGTDVGENSTTFGKTIETRTLNNYNVYI